MSYYAPYPNPTTNPIDWDDVKYWLRLDDDSERARVLDLAGDAVSWAEGYTGSRFVSRAHTVTHYEAEDLLQLPYGPVTAVTSVLSGSTPVAYNLYRAGSYTAVRLTASATFPVAITYTAGYSPLPDAVRRGILMAVEAMYYDRQNPDLSGAMRVLDQWSHKPWTA